MHVEYLAKELSKHVDLTVHGQGADRPTAVAHRPWDRLKNVNPALQTISTGLSMVADMGDVDLVHSHTWYANMAAHLTSLLYGIPRPAIRSGLTRRATAAGNAASPTSTGPASPCRPPSCTRRLPDRPSSQRTHDGARGPDLSADHAMTLAQTPPHRQ